MTAADGIQGRQNPETTLVEEGLDHAFAARTLRRVRFGAVFAGQETEARAKKLTTPTCSVRHNPSSSDS